MILFSLIGFQFHLNGAIATAGRKIFTNSVVSLPQTALVQPLQPQHLAELMEIEIPLQLRNYGQLLEKTAQQKIVSQAELEKSHLPLQADYEAVIGWLKAEGFIITRTDSNRLAIFAKGSVAQIQKSLQVEIMNVRVNGNNFRAAHTHPSLPQAIATPILGINGLQPYLQIHKHTTMPTYGVPYSVNAILTAYNALNLGVTGAGQKIAILIDTVPLDSDLTAFWNDNNISQNLANIEKINVNNVSNAVLTAVTGEETLDVSWSSSIAPGAKIRVYAAGSLNFPDLDKALQQIMSDLPTQPQMHQLSMSLGLGETNLMASSQILTDSQYFALIAASGVTIFAASGDGGATPDNNGVLQVEYYSSDPCVTGVGGTSLSMNSEGAVTSETVWANTGGGVSQVFIRPSWQKGTGIASGSMRLVPDVAFVADQSTGTDIYVNGIAEQVGGTSWGSPAWAGFCALINEARSNASQAPIGMLGPNIYPLIGTPNFRDITSGNNGGYYAGVGYDQTTGIGVPVMSNLIKTLTGTNSSTPSIASFSPVSGTASSLVGITGLNFNQVVMVNFNGVNASTFTVDSSTHITATVPSNASVGPISVITSSGSITSSASFAITTGTLTTLFSTGFESSEGYVTGTLSGQNGWLRSGSGGNTIKTDTADTVFRGYGNQALIGTAQTSNTTLSLWQPINITPASGEIINFSVLCDVIDSTGNASSPRDRFRWSANNINGVRLFSIEFDNATNDISYILDDNIPHFIGNLFSNNTLLNVQMTVDFTRNQWTATLNGETLVAIQPVVTGIEAANLGGFSADRVLNSSRAGSNYMFFDNYTITKSNVVLPVFNTLSTWKSNNFTTSQLADPSISGNLSNPTGDGICNLLDYAFNLNPTVDNSSTVLPQISGTSGYLILTYSANPTATDLTYTVEVSSDLQTWNSGTGYTSMPVILSNNGITQQIQVSDLTPITSENKRFIRLRVTGP